MLSSSTAYIGSIYRSAVFPSSPRKSWHCLRLVAKKEIEIFALCHCVETPTSCLDAKHPRSSLQSFNHDRVFLHLIDSDSIKHATPAKELSYHLGRFQLPYSPSLLIASLWRDKLPVFSLPSAVPPYTALIHFCAGMFASPSEDKYSARPQVPSLLPNLLNTAKTSA